jgi:transcriptional regulator with XRE-family HTH domain
MSLEMERTIRKDLIAKWIKRQGRDGVRALAEKTNIPTSSICKIRGGRIPQDPIKRELLAKALGVKESELFPVTAGKSRAS